jgi:hypothetical protein
MDTKKYTITVETKEYGQRARYGDSYYHYIVSSPDMEEYKLKEFCTKVLEPAISFEDQPKNFGNNFTHYYTCLNTLKKGNWLGKGDELNTIIEYKVVSPSTH